MHKTVLIAPLLLLCSAGNTLGQQSAPAHVSAQSGQMRQSTTDKKQSGPPLTNDSIVRLVKAGMADDLIIEAIHTQPGNYSLDADALIALGNEGVSEEVIHAMLTKGPAPRAGAGHKTYYGVFLAYPETLGDAATIERWRSNLEAHTCLRIVQRPRDADFQIVFSDRAHYAFADKEGHALFEGGMGITGTRQYAELNDWAGCQMKGPVPERSHATAVLAAGTESKGKGKEERAEPNGGTQARGYKDEDGMYRARREDDAEAQRQFDLINEDLIVYVPMCRSADPDLKLEIKKSLKLDEYELSRLMGRDEAKAFHKRMVDEGCLGDSNVKD